jgi:hypothetical protein
LNHSSASNHHHRDLVERSAFPPYAARSADQIGTTKGQAASLLSSFAENAGYR